MRLAEGAKLASLLNCLGEEWCNRNDVEIWEFVFLWEWNCVGDVDRIE